MKKINNNFCPFSLLIENQEESEALFNIVNRIKSDKSLTHNEIVVVESLLKWCDPTRKDTFVI